MISPRDKLDRARSARRLVLLATGASFAATALLLGPGGSGQSMLPAASTANAKESAPQAGRGWIGVQIQPVTANIAESLGMKEDKGALVAEPFTDGPAAKAGILSGDVITALNGQPVNDIRDLAKQIGDLTPGGTAKLTIWRKGEEKTISLTLGEMPKQREARAAAPKADADRVDALKLGLMLASAEHVAGAGSEGVIVIDLDRNGLAFEHGFKIGDIILDVGGKKVVAPIDVRNAVRDAHKDGKRAVLMRLKSDETTSSSPFRSLAPEPGKRLPPDYHISPVGMYAGDRISKKTVPGAFEVPRKLTENLSLLAAAVYYFCSRLRSISFVYARFFVPPSSTPSAENGSGSIRADSRRRDDTRSPQDDDQSATRSSPTV